MAAIVIFDFQNCLILTLLCLFTSLFIFAFVFHYKKQNNGIDLPPSPPSLPIIGHLHLLLTAPLGLAPLHKCFHKISSKYGPFLHLRIFHVPVVLVSSASVAYEIFTGHDINISFRGAVAIDESHVFGSYSFFRAPYGDFWKLMKKLMVTHMTGPHAVEKSRDTRATELQGFYKNLLDKATKNKSVEIGEELRRVVINILGKSMAITFSEGEEVMEFVNELTALSPMFFVAQIFHKPLEKLGISLLKYNIMEVSDRFDGLWEGIIVKHEEKVDSLLAVYPDESAKSEVTRNHIKSLGAELFFAAGDTSSQTARWAMAEILNNPKIFERLREEIDSVVGKTRLIQENDLPKLPYLLAVIKETLRFHPVAPVYSREFTQGCRIRGFYIPKGTSLAINAYTIMRDPEFWNDPDEFQPERFLGQDEETREKALKFLAFGAGRRACAGSNLGYILAQTIVGVMVQCFDWEIEGGENVKTEEASGLRFFMAMAHPLKCTLLPRDINLNIREADEVV
ncbi:hypothetical protein AALP_AA6G273800 [Arabis alpina]|uniref:Cytochrome p450 n=1 Tax=Arabis alpina TaxID=50452 RepID=A0A087GS20_ARAAL|nr:hypothetical protein AALP_AA6G273800 [Arabis alpina]